MVCSKNIVLFYLIVIPIFLVSHPLMITAQNNTNYTNPSLNQSNSSLSLYLVTTDSQVELGNTVVLKHGVINSTTDQFLAGYNYTLFLNSTKLEILKNSTTKDYFDTYVLDTQTKYELRSPGNYSFYFEVYTETVTLNASIGFEIIAKSGAVLDMTIHDISGNSFGNEVYAEMNKTKRMEVKVTNIGSSNAFNISLSYYVINEPVGLSANSSQITDLPILSSLESFAIYFTVNTTTVGKGEIQLDLIFSDGNNFIYKINDRITVITRPQIITQFEISDYLIIGESYEFVLEIFSLEDFNVRFVIRISSSLINFPLAEKEINIYSGSNEISFTGTPTEEGSAQIIFNLFFYDLADGIDLVSAGPPRQYPRTIGLEVTFTGMTNTQRILGILILFNILLFSFIGILFFKANFRNKIYTKIFRMKLIPDLEYPSSSIIVDGSNIAWEEVNTKGKPQISNILLAINHLKEKGFGEVIVVADAALRYQLSSTNELDNISERDLIKVLPAKVNADSFILRLSAQKGSLILSNDLFKEFRDQYPWIDERRVPYTIMDGQFYLHPIYKKAN
ncbi:MAG: hypothetical protein INQ03_01905 [Candidatus Heimdallarchaeota archaeon]|nr:hypothetical protein [Candidatus Heimdallarchaeota archaeon]